MRAPALGDGGDGDPSLSGVSLPPRRLSASTASFPLPSSPFSRFCSPPKARLPPLPCPPGVLRGSPLNPCGLEQCPAGRRHSVNESLWLLGRAKARSCVRRDDRKRKGGHRRSAVTWRAGTGLSLEDSAWGPILFANGSAVRVSSPACEENAFKMDAFASSSVLPANDSRFILTEKGSGSALG